MPGRWKDTDFLSISSRVRVLESRLLTRDGAERMLAAPTGEGAARVLAELGYPELSRLTPPALQAMLARARAETFRDMEEGIPERGVVTVFRIRYDYHNAKVLVKAQVVGAEAGSLLEEGGRYPPSRLQEWYERENLEETTPLFREAVVRARDLLAARSSPQRADVLLDRACCGEMLQTAQDTGSGFLTGYVRLLVDGANLRTAVRAFRRGKGRDFLSDVLLEGGNVPADRICQAEEGEAFSLFGGALAQAAALGARLAAPGSGPLTDFEQACDRALADYLAGAGRVPFGEQPVVGYLGAKEREWTAIRVILTGRMNGLEPHLIRERLGEAYG